MYCKHVQIFLPAKQVALGLNIYKKLSAIIKEIFVNKVKLNYYKFEVHCTVYIYGENENRLFFMGG